jgi:hypothetical protein
MRSSYKCKEDEAMILFTLFIIGLTEAFVAYPGNCPEEKEIIGADPMM